MRNRLARNGEPAYIPAMSDSDSRPPPPTELAAFTVVDLLDAVAQAARGDGSLLEQSVLAGLLRVSACEDLPELMRALAGRLVADQLAQAPVSDEPQEGLWLLH